MRAQALAVLISAALLAGCGNKDNASTVAAADNLAPPPAADVQPTPEQAAALLAQLPAPYNTANLDNGQAQSALCRSCHTFTDGGPDLVGPNLHGVFGRVIGTKPGFAYSDPVKAAGFTWDPAHLDQWLANPQVYIPNTKMTFVGIKGDKDRVDLIGYLKVQTSFTPPAPGAN